MKHYQVSTGSMLHGLMLRPPRLLWDGNRYTGSLLQSADTRAAQEVPGVVQIVIDNHFIGIVAAQLQAARHARSLVHVEWAEPARPDSTQTATPVEHPDLSRTYLWPDTSSQPQQYPEALASFEDGSLIVQALTRQPDQLRHEIAVLCQLPIDAVQLICQAPGSSRTNPDTAVEAYDTAVDAALLAFHLKRTIKVLGDTPLPPVTTRIQLNANLGNTQEDQLLVQACTIYGNQYAARRPALATLLTGGTGHHPASTTSCSGYYPDSSRYLVEPQNADIIHEPSIASLAAQTFAYESFFDEACHEQGVDPVQARLNALGDSAGASLLASVASRANWQAKTALTRKAASYTGTGVACAHIIDHQQTPPQQIWSTWIADVSIHPDTGAIDLNRLTVGHHCENLQDTVSDIDSIEDHVRQAATQLVDTTQYDSWGQDTDNPPDNRSLTTKAPDVQLVASSGNSPAGLAWSNYAQLPAAAAIANAIHDATGVRLRQAPFDTNTLKTQLETSHSKRKSGLWAGLGALAVTLGGIVVSALPWRPAIPPAVAIDTSIYSEEAINRGRLVAIAGDCMVCHTAPSGTPNAGGLGLETPFGIIYSTNITPDKETGIGTWTYAAFERAMRQGIHQDGRHLYPAFPYTAFAKISDADMQSLYAWLMTQEPVKATPPENALRFPYSIRPLVAGWNALYHRNEAFTPDPEQSTLWNRGAYLVQGMGHCAACHSPRNALGAEKSGGLNFLGGGFAEGWEAPPLNTLSKAPLPWTENDLFQYLRTGFSPLHGVAAGPMAPVVQGLAQLPEADVRAMAHYLSSLNPVPATDANQDTSLALQAARLEDRSRNDESTLLLPGESLFEGACAVCHDARGGPPLFGARPSLALNTNLHSDSPDNLIQVLLQGIPEPAHDHLGTMPAFGDSLNDDQLLTLVRYLRTRFAPDKKPWTGLEEKIKALREPAG